MKAQLDQVLIVILAEDISLGRGRLGQEDEEEAAPAT
jgi:hypothetical protein